jgi:hypothetical protein
MYFILLIMLLLGCLSRPEVVLIASITFCSWYIFNLFGEGLYSFGTFLFIVMTAATYPLSLYGVSLLVERATGLYFIRPLIAPLVLIIASHHLFSSGMIVDLLAADLYAAQTGTFLSLPTLALKLGGTIKIAMIISVVFASLWLLVELPLRVGARVAGVAFDYECGIYRLLLVIAFMYMLFALISDWLIAKV